MVAVLMAILLGVSDSRYSGYWYDHSGIVRDCSCSVEDSEVILASYSLVPTGDAGRLLIIFERDGKLAQIYSPRRTLMDPCPVPLEASLAVLKAYAIELLAYDLDAMNRLLLMVE